MKSIVYLLCGLPGSGKTVYAKKLKQDGIIRFSLDEELFKKYGNGFPAEKYKTYESETKKFILAQLISLLKTNSSAVLDWGFWKRDERDKIKQMIMNFNAQWRLIYFKFDKTKLKERLDRRDLKENHKIDSNMFAHFTEEFEEPDDEGETILS